METQKTIEVTLSQRSPITAETIHQLDELFSFGSPAKLREHLQVVFFSYLIHEHDLLPQDFQSMAGHLQLLFEFLDKQGNSDQS